MLKATGCIEAGPGENIMWYELTVASAMNDKMFKRSHYGGVIMELPSKYYLSSLRNSKCTPVHNISSHLFIQMADSQRQFFKLVNENLAWIFSSRTIFNN